MDWITRDETRTLIVLAAFGLQCIFGALYVELIGRERRRNKDLRAANRKLRRALNDARRQRGVQVYEPPQPQPRLERVWPGRNAGKLPVHYGDELDTDRLAPFRSPNRSWFASTREAVSA